MKHPVDEMRNNRKLNGGRVKAKPGGHGGYSAFTCAKIEHPLNFVFAVRISILGITAEPVLRDPRSNQGVVAGDHEVKLSWISEPVR